MAWLNDVLSWLLLTGGGIFVLIGGIGALRLPDIYSRMHAASLTDSTGTLLVLLGVLLQAGWSLAGAKLVVIALFMLMTGPTASYAVANAALLAGISPRGRLLQQHQHQQQQQHQHQQQQQHPPSSPA